MCDHPSDTVRTVYQLREAAVNHGRALAAADLIPSPTTRDRVLDTKMELEELTVAAIDVCTDDSESAGEPRLDGPADGKAVA